MASPSGGAILFSRDRRIPHSASDSYQGTTSEAAETVEFWVMTPTKVVIISGILVTRVFPASLFFFPLLSHRVISH